MKAYFYLLIVFVVIITVIGLPLDLMAPDAALYGSIAKTMYLQNDFINLYAFDADWLDKPHLPFWLTAISYKLFGFNNIAYKLPGVLIFFLGCWATYQFTKENYSKKTAITATIILITSLHSIISNFDVRAEAYLTGFMMTALYYFVRYINQKKWSNLIIACLCCGLALMTKGIFALIPIVAAIGGHLLIKRQIKEILNPMWLIAVILILIFTLPELYTLYVQFDLHPEKTVFGKTNVSGIQFFFWDSQFGRFFNTGPIQGSGDKFFFFHTILWAFLPWGILFYIASFFKVKTSIKNKIVNSEYYTFFGAWSAIIIFSLSKFQLPHYTNIVFPFMAILTADFIVKLSEVYKKTETIYKITQWFSIVISIIVIPVVFVFVKPKVNFIFLSLIIFAITFCLYIYKSKLNNIYKILFYTSISYCVLYGFMFTHFYPTILQYQGGASLAKYASKNISETIYYPRHFQDLGFLYYSNENKKIIEKIDTEKDKGKLLFINEKDFTNLKNNNSPLVVEKIFDNYRITKLTPNFLNPKTRAKELQKFYLVRLQ